MGEETARLFADAGANVAVADVATAGEVEAMVAEVRARWGRLDVAVNSAGVIPQWT